jgi:hypothetical protein
VLTVTPKECALHEHDLSAGRMLELKIELNEANATGSRILTYDRALEGWATWFRYASSSQSASKFNTHPAYGYRPLRTYKTCDPKEYSANSLRNLEGHPAPKCSHAFNDFRTSDYSELQARQRNVNGINRWVFVAVTHECDFTSLCLPALSHFTNVHYL